MTIDLRWVEALVTVVREGSLTRAELVSGVSKATLSRHLDKLEQHLGTQLLTRTSRRVSPTEAGRAFYTQSATLLNEVQSRLDASRALLQNLDDGVSGSLSLLTETLFGTSFVCHVVSLYMERHPNVRCELSLVGERGAPALEDVDCYICSVPPDHPNLVAKVLGRQSYGFYASPRYLAGVSAPETPAELEHHKVIGMRSDGATTFATELHSRNETRKYSPMPSSVTNDYWLMKTLCINGFGIALMPDFFARPEASQGVLVPVLPGWRPTPRPIYCVFQKQRYMSRKLRGFVDLLAARIADIDSYQAYVGSPIRREF